MDFERLKALLEEQETFPHDFTIKFIGANSPAFLGGVRSLEARFPELKKQGERRSANDSNLALTYVLRAEDADEIIEVLKEVHRIPDVKVIL